MPLTPNLDKLLSFAGPSLVDAPPLFGVATERLAGARAEELRSLLRERDGFYAFESALHVFPAAEKTGVMDLEQWNSPELWRKEYGAMADRCLFFAEDAFGHPFVLRDDRVWSMEPENGNMEEVASDLEGWAKHVLDDVDMTTGFAHARRWQQMRGPLKPGKRLFPGIPFVLGGTFEMDNLAEVDATKAMRVRGKIARQLQNVPKGAKVQIKIK